jgi:hypothetical protein
MKSERPRAVVAYYRISTDKQGFAGLGMEAQQAAVEGFARQNGAEIVAAYREAESGRNSARPSCVRIPGLRITAHYLIPLLRASCARSPKALN